MTVTATTATLEEVAVLAEGLSLQDQHKLLSQVQARVERAERVAQADELIRRLREIAIPSDGIDSAEMIRQMREERMEQLCQNSA